MIFQHQVVHDDLVERVRTILSEKRGTDRVLTFQHVKYVEVDLVVLGFNGSLETIYEVKGRHYEWGEREATKQLRRSCQLAHALYGVYVSQHEGELVAKIKYRR